MAVMSSREFIQHASEAKKAAGQGPVIITERGRPSHVLLSYGEYQRLSEAQGGIVDLLGMPGGEEVEFEPERLELSLNPAALD